MPDQLGSWPVAIQSVWNRLASAWNVVGKGFDAASGTYNPLWVDEDGLLHVAVDYSVGGSGSAGVQYTEGDVDASITGTAIMWEDAGDTLRAVSADKRLPVDLAAGGCTLGEGSWVRDAGLIGDPAAGEWQQDNGSPSVVTKLWFNVTDNDAIDRTRELLLLKHGSIISLDDGAERVTYRCLFEANMYTPGADVVEIEVEIVQASVSPSPPTVGNTFRVLFDYPGENLGYTAGEDAATNTAKGVVAMWVDNSDDSANVVSPLTPLPTEVNELPVPSTPTDTMSNATPALSKILAFGAVWNGATWSRQAGAAGVISNGTTRVVLASNDAAVTALQIIDDWDESDRAKVNPIAGQAGVQGGSGIVNALTQRVVLATDVGLPAVTKTQAVYVPSAGIDATTLSSSTYTAVITVGGTFKHVSVWYTGDHPIEISFDGGTTVHFRMTGGYLPIDYEQLTLFEASGTVHIRRESTTPTRGRLYVTAMR